MCLIAHSDLRQIGAWQSDAQDVSLAHADLRDAALGGAIGRTANRYSRVDFTRANLTNAGHSFEEYEDCDFSHARLKEVNFDGARFRRCRFAGVLDSVLFRLHPANTPLPLGPWEKRVDPKSFANPMEQVDYSNAELRGVDFDGVDLSTCLFPADGNHLVIPQQLEVFRAAREVVAREWAGKEREVAIDLLDAMYLSIDRLEGSFMTPEKLEQPIQVVNRKDFQEWFDPGPGERLYRILEKLVEEDRSRARS